jgi:Mor family transcriptional regulator
MTHHPIHLLHLTGAWLRWVTIQPGTLPQVTDSGTIEAGPESALEQWAARLQDRRARIVLYDGRPIYYNFALTMPTEALKQKDRILKLKLAQEIGLSDEAVFWSAQIEPRKDNPGQSDVFMVVARRETMQDIISWRERRRLASVWVGADLCAIRALLGQAAAPLVLVAMDPQGGATFFHANNIGQILKEKADERISPRADLAWSGATGRMHFGGEIPGGLYDRYPTLATLQLLPNAQLQHPAAGPSRLSLVPPQILEFDPVLLGGILEHGTGRPPTEDLVRVIGMDATIRLCTEYGGTPLYVPKVDGLVVANRRAEILAEYNGYNVRKLAAKYRLTIRAVEMMVQGVRPPEINGQLTLQDITGGP